MSKDDKEREAQLDREMTREIDFVTQSHSL